MAQHPYGGQRTAFRRKSVLSFHMRQGLSNASATALYNPESPAITTVRAYCVPVSGMSPTSTVKLPPQCNQLSMLDLEEASLSILATLVSFAMLRI